MSEIREVLAGNIRREARRKKTGINALADAAKVSRSQMYDVLGEKKSASVDWIDRAAKALRVEPWQLVKPS